MGCAAGLPRFKMAPGCVQAVRRLCVTRVHHMLISARAATDCVQADFFAASCRDVHRKILKDWAKKELSRRFHNLDRARPRV
jgi:hypothetical protein